MEVDLSESSLSVSVPWLVVHKRSSLVFKGYDRSGAFSVDQLDK
jgi:hypothetical protein